MIKLFGLALHNLPMTDAVELLSTALSRSSDGRPVTAYFVNTHTARLAAGRAASLAVLRRADHLFVDGMGIRIASLLRGQRRRANLVGTDLVPALLQARGSGRCFLLGGTDAINEAAAAYVETNFPRWQVVGRRDGYFGDRSGADGQASVVEAINESRAELVLVGMGNPRQEEWIDRHAEALRAQVCLGVGGLFHHWAGDLVRAPSWVRRAGLEWVQLCLQQPGRIRRYVVDVPVFLGRALWTAPSDRRAKIHLDIFVS